MSTELNLFRHNKFMTTQRVFHIIAMMFLLNGCSLFYVAKQGSFQAQLLASAEPIEIALRSGDISFQQRKKLELVLDVRSFTKKHLHLHVHKSYKDINLSWHNVIHTVSASQPLAFKPYLWWFPIIGYVPYKGYFNENDADEEELRLKQLGYETDKRQVEGYSTLGYFADPLWPAMLELNDYALVELIIHELAHATVYIANQTPFNETFASFIGKVGARNYFEHRFGKNSDELAGFDRYQERNHRYQKFFGDLYEELEKIFAQDLADDLKREQKNSAMNHARERYQKLVAKKLMPEIDWSSLNNASLLSYKTYHHDSEIFARLLALNQNNFARFIEEVNFYGRSDDPFLALWERVRRLQNVARKP